MNPSPTTLALAGVARPNGSSIATMAKTVAVARLLIGLVGTRRSAPRRMGFVCFLRIMMPRLSHGSGWSPSTDGSPCLGWVLVVRFIDSAFRGVR